jgi:hypothetical protein
LGIKEKGMKMASTLFVLILLASLLPDAGAQTRPGGHGQGHYNPSPYPQPSSQQGQIISQRVNQNLRMYERARLSELLRVSRQDESLEVTSLSLEASSLYGQARVDILSVSGQILGSGIVRRNQGSIQVQLPPRTRISDIEISPSENILLESVSAQVERPYIPAPIPQQDRQPAPQQMLRLMVNQDIRGMGEIHLKQLVKQQLGLTLEGSEIERVVVEASVSYGRAASVQVELNNRPVGPMKNLSSSIRATPLPVNSSEEARSLKLIVRGDARIEMVHIRIGQVRPIYNQNQVQRIIVGQEISSGRPLELSRLLPYESRMITSIAIDARGSRNSAAEVALVAFSQVLGSVIVRNAPMRQEIQLMRPMQARDLRLQSLSPVIIDSLEISFSRY